MSIGTGFGEMGRRSGRKKQTKLKQSTWQNMDSSDGPEGKRKEKRISPLVLEKKLKLEPPSPTVGYFVCWGVPVTFPH